MEVVTPSEDSNSQDSLEFGPEARHGVYPQNSHGYGAQPDTYALAPMAMNQFDYQVCRVPCRMCSKRLVLFFLVGEPRRRREAGVLQSGGVSAGSRSVRALSMLCRECTLIEGSGMVRVKSHPLYLTSYLLLISTVNLKLSYFSDKATTINAKATAVP